MLLLLYLFGALGYLSIVQAQKPFQISILLRPHSSISTFNDTELEEFAKCLGIIGETAILYPHGDWEVIKICIPSKFAHYHPLYKTNEPFGYPTEMRYDYMNKVESCLEVLGLDREVLFDSCRTRLRRALDECGPGCMFSYTHERRVKKKGCKDGRTSSTDFERRVIGNDQADSKCWAQLAYGKVIKPLAMLLSYAFMSGIHSGLVKMS